MNPGDRLPPARSRITPDAMAYPATSPGAVRWVREDRPGRAGIQLVLEKVTFPSLEQI